jgi:peptidoglycan/LPS O-acetylase OafA/YrhL
MSSMTTQRHHYVAAFDGLRALAIMPVILLHVSVATLPEGAWLRRQLERGWYGVDLFFVLSGFLITWILMEEMEVSGTIALSRFYSRRFLRLGPAYASTLLVLLAGTALLAPNSLRQVPRVAPALLTYTYNYQLALQGPHVDLLVIVWSLCVEEQFYLVWPWVLRSIGMHRGFYLCAAAVTVLALYRMALYASSNWGHLGSPTAASAIRIYFSTDTRVDVIFIGCLAALSLRHQRTCRFWQQLCEWRHFPYAMAATAFACLAWVTGGNVSSTSIRSATIGYTLGALAVAGLIVAIFTRPDSVLARALSWQPLVELGKVSYGMYLFHLMIAWGVFSLLEPVVWSHVTSSMSNPGLLGPALPLSKATVVPVSDALGGVSTLLKDDSLLKFSITFAIVTLAAFIVAWLHFQFIERRFMALRRPISFRAAIPDRET